MSPAETAVRRIVEQYGRSRPATGNGLLDAVANIRPDRHDVAGAVFIAEEALGMTDDDALRPTLERLIEFRRADKRYDARDMTGILALCEQGLQAVEEPSYSRPRP
jgi:hypothetical protein